MVLLLFFLYFSIVQYIRIVVEPLDKNAPHLAISRLRDALSYKAVKPSVEHIPRESTLHWGSCTRDLVRVLSKTIKSL